MKKNKQFDIRTPKVKRLKEVNVFGVNECTICDSNRSLKKGYPQDNATDLLY